MVELAASCSSFVVHAHDQRVTVTIGDPGWSRATNMIRLQVFAVCLAVAGERLRAPARWSAFLDSTEHISAFVAAVVCSRVHM